MNKYIKTDIEQGFKYLKTGVMNALSDLENGTEKEINFEFPVPLQLVIDCAEERGWKDDHDDDWTNGWEVDYCYLMIHPDIEDKYLAISGSLLQGKTVISLENNI